MSILDLHHLQPEDLRTLNEISQQIKRKFSDVIDSLSQRYGNNLDWQVSSISSRDINMSSLFLNCCYLIFVKKMLFDREEIKEITVYSKAFKAVLDKYLSEKQIDVKVNCVESRIGRYKARLLNITRVGYSLFDFIIRYCVFRLGRKAVYARPVTLIDTFFLNTSIVNGEYRDRYFGKMLDYLNSDEKQFIYYVPTFIGVRNYWKVKADINKCSSKFLLKEDFLKPSDYIFAITHAFRIKKIALCKVFFSDFDITPLIEEEIKINSGNRSSILGVLNYCFIKRLQEAQVNVDLFINWFENQAVDRGLNRGFRTFFPDVPSVGYLGSPYFTNYIHIIPTRQDKRWGLIPEVIAVMGRGYLNSAKEFCDDLNVSVAPAFRFEHLWREGIKQTDSGSFTILVALPITLPEGNEILNMLASLLDKQEFNNVKINIKPHPTNKADKIKKYFSKSWPDRFEMVEGDFGEWLEESDLLISNGSSTCLETAAKGIPVIIIGSQSGLTQNPIPQSINEVIWRLCYTAEELLEAITYYANRDDETIRRHEEIGRRIRAEYFEPVTPEGVRRFLRLDKVAERHEEER